MSPVEADLANHRIRQRAKLALRKQMRAVREALPQDACDARSHEIAKRVLTLAEFERATTVLAFASIRKEVRTRELMEAAWTAGKRVALPRVADDKLSLHWVDSDTELVEGAFSVPEPSREAKRVDATEVEFALVPALAVDPRGYRIGYGGGYYDELLPRLERASSCAVAYDFQLIAEVPELPFDVAVDVVVTDARVIRAG